MAIKVLLVDDHKLFREGIRSVLSQYPGITIVGEADNGRDVETLVTQHLPDVVVMDISMPELNGVSATERLLHSHPDCKVIALTMHAEKRIVLDMLKTGAKGYILKGCTSEELYNAIKSAMKDHTYLCAEISELVVDAYRKLARPEEQSSTAELSLREKEVLQLLAEGFATRQIAEKLCLSVKTIETHRSNIMKKLGLTTLADLVKYALRENLTSL